MKRSEIVLTALLVPLDVLALFASFIFAYHLRDTYQLNPSAVGALSARFEYQGTGISLPFSQYLHYLFFIVPMMVAIFGAAGLYSIRQSLSGWRRFFQILIGVSTGEFFILLLFLLKKNFFIPRATVLYSWIIATVLLLVVRLIFAGIRKLLYQRGIGVVRLAVVGHNKSAEQLVNQLGAQPGTGYQVVTHIGGLESEALMKKIDEEKLDELIVVSAQYDNDEMMALRNHCLEHQIGFSFVPPLLTEMTSSFSIRTLGHLPVVEVRPTPLEGWGRVLKRIFDIVSSLLLIVLFSPVYLLLYIVMKVSDPGPVLYKHRRIGKDRRPIDVYKFRSMRWEYCDGPGGNPVGEANKERLFAENPDLAAEWAANFKLKNDPRISKIGKVLRSTSLDELPQFFNVLGGSLSLVGPRPIVQKEIGYYADKARILFTVKPGVTGLWQVSGRSDVSYEERISLDTAYIEQWNIWRDIKIMFQTAGVLLKAIFSRSKGGAY